jgi:hypothetical protein
MENGFHHQTGCRSVEGGARLAEAPVQKAKILTKMREKNTLEPESKQRRTDPFLNLPFHDGIEPAGF